MNIRFFSFSYETLPLLKKNMLQSLTSQQKKIFIISSLVFGCILAICYVTYRCFFKAVPLTASDTIFPHPSFKKEDIPVSQLAEKTFQSDTDNEEESKPTQTIHVEPFLTYENIPNLHTAEETHQSDTDNEEESKPTQTIHVEPFLTYENIPNSHTAEEMHQSDTDNKEKSEPTQTIHVEPFLTCENIPNSHTAEEMHQSDADNKEKSEPTQTIHVEPFLTYENIPTSHTAEETSLVQENIDQAIPREEIKLNKKIVEEQVSLEPYSSHPESSNSEKTEKEVTIENIYLQIDMNPPKNELEVEGNLVDNTQVKVDTKSSQVESNTEEAQVNGATKIFSQNGRDGKKDVRKTFVAHQVLNSSEKKAEKNKIMSLSVSGLKSLEKHSKNAKKELAVMAETAKKAIQNPFDEFIRNEQIFRKNLEIIQLYTKELTRIIKRPETLKNLAPELDLVLIKDLRSSLKRFVEVLKVIAPFSKKIKDLTIDELPTFAEIYLKTDFSPLFPIIGMQEKFNDLVMNANKNKKEAIFQLFKNLKGQQLEKFKNKHNDIDDIDDIVSSVFQRVGRYVITLNETLKCVTADTAVSQITAPSEVFQIIELCYKKALMQAEVINKWS